MANNTKTWMGSIRAVQGAACETCGTHYINLYSVEGKSLCHRCFKKQSPEEFRKVVNYKKYVCGMIPFSTWENAGCPIDYNTIKTLGGW